MSCEIVSASGQPIGRNVLLYPLLQQLKVAQTIDATVPSCAQLPLGSVAEIIILSRFAPKRVPMYHLDRFAVENGLNTLYGICGDKLNDDRVGRCLDAIQPHLGDLKAALVLRAIKRFNLTTSQIHTDITNILFEGRYDESQSDQLTVTWGHTKKGEDPRCKQVKFSLSVTADGGVPLWYEALSGNRTDSVCYTDHLSAFDKQLSITQPLCVGDSKLVSNSNMIAFIKASAFFIGPATLDQNEKKRLKRLWEEGIGFEALSFKASDKEPIAYWALEGQKQISDKKTKEKYPIRQLYIFSRQRRAVIRHTRAKNFLRAKKALHKICRCLNKYDYKSARVILTRLQNQVLAKCPYYQVKLKKNELGLFYISYSIDWGQLALDEMFDGIYLLRTNTPKERFEMNDVLESYKAQPYVERGFETIKQPPIAISPVWLHNEKRIESLLFLVFIALMVLALLQREGRQKVWPKSIALRPEGRDHLPLTSAVLLAAFDTLILLTVTVKVGNQFLTDTRLSTLSPTQRQVLEALGSYPWVNQNL